MSFHCTYGANIGRGVHCKMYSSSLLWAQEHCMQAKLSHSLKLTKLSPSFKAEIQKVQICLGALFGVGVGYSFCENDI